MASSTEEEIFEVEKIVNHRFTKQGKKNKILYFIKWLNYDDKDNTWEKENNVYVINITGFAVELIKKYWETFPEDSSERKAFEEVQSRRKNPIKLDSTKHVSSKTNKITDIFTQQQDNPNENKRAGMNVPETVASSSLSPNPFTIQIPPIKRQQKLQESFAVISKPVDDDKKSKVKNPVRAPEQDADKNTERRQPVVIANDDTIDELDEENKSNKQPDAISVTDSDYVASSGNSMHDEEEVDELELEDESMDEDKIDEIDDSSNDEAKEVIASEPTAQKRKRAGYSDYFLEQHESKRKREKKKHSTGSDDDVSSVTSSIESVNDQSNEVDEKWDKNVIFDENYAIDPPVDWNNLADKVEYIGRELKDSPLYCAVRWKDSIRSFHPLSLVRVKRPDLVIDYFIRLTEEKIDTNSNWK
ncbi:MAG: hypothetical protein EXX96DRAFT_537911 [Benjaminiella poitrasii]|nr:MAG: hypothetical protein EXX96DRAFT_537911 [Benjaminiella poitrasii]